MGRLFVFRKTTYFRAMPNIVGLSPRFTLSNGRFSFTSNEVKAKDNLFFFMQFAFVSRIYLRDFNPALWGVIQQPTSVLQQFKVLILAHLKKKIEQYVPNIKVDSMDVLQNRSEKSSAVIVNYTYSNQPDVQQLVTFV